MRGRLRRALAWASICAILAAPSPALAKKKAPAQDGKKALCPRLTIVGPNIDLTEVEKRLVCGNDQSEGWKNVPLNEARYFMKAFLQRRGYHYPRFEAQGDLLTVHVGTQTHISKIVGRGLGELYDFGKKRLIVGKPLTPEEMDLLKSDVMSRLEEQGYACPKLAVDGDARTGVVTVSGDPGVFYNLTYIQTPPVAGLDPGIFNRFQAHQYGEPLDVRLLNLTSERITQEALFQSAYYELQCSTAGLHVAQRIVEAKPHMVTLDFGVDTEGYARGRAQWRNSRIGYRASSAEATLFASYREISFDALMHYYLRPEDRINLEPTFLAQRSNEVQYETVEQQAGVAPNWTWDNESLHLDVQGGPVFEYFNTLRGLGPVNDTFFAFKTKMTVMSHMFEYYQRDPRMGWQLGFESSSREAGAYSSITAQRLRLYSQKLWNVGDFNPPLFVVATRGWAGVIAADQTQAFNQLPPTERFYLGGDADVRGAGRQQLPGDGLGFLTAGYQGVELRINDVLPYKIQPLIFGDAAMAGRRSWHMDRDIYYSPGLGARWASPFGAVRFTAARGMVARASPENPTSLPRWQYFATFGTEF
jgi:translocation and assembly module TamA